MLPSSAAEPLIAVMYQCIAVCGAGLPDKLLLDDRGYSHVLDADQYTDVSIDNMEGGRCADNIWLSRGVQSAHTGSAFNCLRDSSEKCLML